MTKLFHQMSSWPSCFDELTLLLGNIASQSFIHNITQCVLDTLALYTSCITMWITHITPCTPLCDGRPLSFLEYIGVNQEQFTCQFNKEASPLSSSPCRRSFQKFLSAQRGKWFLQDHPIVAATLSHPDHFKQYSFYFTIDINVCKPRYRYRLC